MLGLPNTKPVGTGIPTDCRCYATRWRASIIGSAFGCATRPRGGSTIGALVTVTAHGRTHVDRVVTGDSFTAQHAPVVHFGLGDSDKIESLTVQWMDGRAISVDNPTTVR